MGEDECMFNECKTKIGGEKLEWSNCHLFNE